MSRNRLTQIGVAVVILLGLLAFIGGCTPTTSTTTPPPSGQASSNTSTIYLIVFLVLIFAAFYFLTIRPQRRRQKQQQELLKGLQRGDRVITIGGIYGEIESIDETSVVLRVESGTLIRVARTGILGKRTPQQQ